MNEDGNSIEPKTDSGIVGAAKIPDTRVTFYFDGNDRWLRRDWAPQCSHKILHLRRCQGVDGHDGEHWCFAPNGSYHWSRDKDHPDYQQGASGMIPPTSAGYRSPLEMDPNYHRNHHEDHEVTDPEELARLNRGDFLPEESVDRPCTEEEVEMLRATGRLDDIESHER